MLPLHRLSLRRLSLRRSFMRRLSVRRLSVRNRWQRIGSRAASHRVAAVSCIALVCTAATTLVTRSTGVAVLLCTIGMIAVMAMGIAASRAARVPRYDDRWVRAHVARGLVELERYANHETGGRPT